MSASFPVLLLGAKALPERRGWLSVPQIMVIGSPLSMNLGGPSVFLGLLEIFRSLGELGDKARYVLATSPVDWDLEKQIAEKFNVTVVPFRRSNKWWARAVQDCCGLGSSKDIAWRQFIFNLKRSALVVSAPGLIFSDALGANTFRGRLSEGLGFGLARIYGKKIVQNTADIGPARAFWNRFFARSFLKMCSVISCRSEESAREAERLGIPSERVLTAPDAGFLMPTQSSEILEQIRGRAGNRPIVGLSVSFQVKRRCSRPEDYLEAMAELASYFINKHGAYVLVIPNELHKDPQRDDGVVARELTERISSSASEALEPTTLSGPEIKAVIGACECLFAARYHSLVAALSQGIPSLAIGWHYKYRSLLKLTGMEEWVFDFRSLEISQLIQAGDRMWLQRSALREEIRARLPGIYKQILSQGTRMLTIAGVNSKL